jgi:trk system potassium uptake protein TrkA
MNFIVVGCGRVGAELCYHLFKRGHQIVVVDINKEAFNRLHPDFRGRTLEGEGLAEGVLERAGNVVARNYDPNLRSVIESFNLQTVGSTYWGAQRVEELLMNPSQRMVYSAGNGEVEVYEIQISDQWNGRTLGELLGPLNQCYPVALSRAGHALLPETGIRLQTGDMLDVSSTFEGIGALTERISKNGEA